MPLTKKIDRRRFLIYRKLLSAWGGLGALERRVLSGNIIDTASRIHKKSKAITFGDLVASIQIKAITFDDVSGAKPGEPLSKDQTEYLFAPLNLSDSAPVIMTASGVLNGWRRVLIARALHSKTVPCHVVPDVEASTWMILGLIRAASEPEAHPHN